MGARGPQPKPLAIRLAEGNVSRRPINMADGMNPPVEIPEPPGWLCREARREWERASIELHALGAIAKIDRAKFAIYCQAWGQLCQLEIAFAVRQKEAVDAAKKSGRDPALAITDPFFGKTPTGFLRQGHMAREIGEMREQVHRYAASFGLDPSSRSRVKPSDFQLPLPGFGAPPAANENAAPSLKNFNWA